MLPRTAAAILCGFALHGCGGGSGGGAAAPEPTATAAAGPVVPLGCEHAIPATRVKVPAGLVRPRGVRVIAGSRNRRPDDPRITVVEGYVELVPSKLAKAFREAPGIEVLFTEDEEFEAELLVSDGRHRAFWKVVRTCLAASKFTALYSIERSGDAVARAAPPTKKPVTGRGGRRRPR